MEDQKKKKSIVYLLQGLAGNIRNKMNWQLQGYLHYNTKILWKSCRYKPTLNSGPQYDTDFILSWVGFTNITALNYGHPNPFFSAMFFFTYKLQTVTGAQLAHLVSLKTTENSQTFLTSETLLYIEILNAKLPVTLSVLSFAILTSDPLIYFFCRGSTSLC